jgi:pilus assembly protein CpaC
MIQSLPVSLFVGMAALFAVAQAHAQSEGPQAAEAMPQAQETALPSTAKEIEVPMGGSSLVTLPGNVESVVVAVAAVADAKPVSPREVVLVARRPGTSDVVFRLESGESIVRTMRVRVDRAEIEGRLRRLFGVTLEVVDVEGHMTLRGVVPDVRTAAQIDKFMDSLDPTWIDLTTIPGVQQVQLRVRIAEASRTALRELAFGGVVGGSTAFGGFQSPGGTPFQPVSIGPSPFAPVDSAQFIFDRGFGNTVQPATTLFGGIPGSNLEIFIQALSENRYVRLLAEPNLVAISGEEATFLVGGEFPVPVVQGSVVGGGSTVTVQYKEFGVRLKFRPEVLGEGRLRLEVSPEVSELSEIGAVRQNGFTIPSVITRRSSTTVELTSGQSFAMAGLLRTKDQARASRVPVLGDLPVLGTLFRSVRYEQDQTELVVMVTAELVEPLDDGMDRPMPGDLHQTPNDWELFGEGKLAGATDVGNPLSRLKALGLGSLRGPGAWRRSDDRRVPAADALPPVMDLDSSPPPSAPATGDAARTLPRGEPPIVGAAVSARSEPALP